MNYRVLAACALAVTACRPEPSLDLTLLTGEQIFLTKCVACHQVDGSGIPGICPPLDISPHLLGPDAVRIMLLGMKGRIVRNGQVYDGVMPAWKFDLNDDQIAAVLNEISRRWNPHSPEVTGEIVRQIRQQTAGHKIFPTVQELGLAESPGKGP